MANLAETPQEFKYETKFVVLNYLGILPRFEEIGDESDGESDDRLDDDGDDAMSFGLRSQASSHSQDTPSSIDSDSCSRDSEEFRQIRRIAAAGILAGMPPQEQESAVRSIDASTVAFQGQGLEVDAVGSEDTLEGFHLPTDDLARDAVSSNTSSASSSKFGASPPSFTSRMPALKVSRVESPRSRTSMLRKKRSRDASLDESTKKRMSNVLSELESQFKQEMVEGGMDSAGVLCAISREALVAERIAQIGDCIMLHHQGELEQAYQQAMSHGAGPLNYGSFKSGMKSLVKNSVPGWYHVAVMMKYTRQMAVSVLDQGSRGIAAVTDFAAQYIEENLAQAILEQGGWDAITNVDLEKIDNETWSEISSGNPSPQGIQSPTHTIPPLFMDEDGFLSPRQRKSGSDQGNQPPDSMSGLNAASNIKLETEHGATNRDESDSVSAAVSRPQGLLLDGSIMQTDMDLSPGRRRYQSERVPDQPDLLDPDDSPRRRASSFGSRPMIATAAACTATVAAVAAVGAFALLKK